jgi:hypothetical protein
MLVALAPPPRFELPVVAVFGQSRGLSALAIRQSRPVVDGLRPAQGSGHLNGALATRVAIRLVRYRLVPMRGEREGRQAREVATQPGRKERYK